MIVATELCNILPLGYVKKYARYIRMVVVSGTEYKLYSMCSNKYYSSVLLILNLFEFVLWFLSWCVYFFRKNSFVKWRWDPSSTRWTMVLISERYVLHIICEAWLSNKLEQVVLYYAKVFALHQVQVRLTDIYCSIKGLFTRTASHLFVNGISIFLTLCMQAPYWYIQPIFKWHRIQVTLTVRLNRRSEVLLCFEIRYWYQMLL